jgi:hypothetical protein
MSKTWERLIIYADSLGLEFEFKCERNTLEFFSRCEKIGTLSKCKPIGWVLDSPCGYRQFSNEPKKLISRIREIA